MSTATIISGLIILVIMLSLTLAYMICCMNSGPVKGTPPEPDTFDSEWIDFPTKEETESTNITSLEEGQQIRRDILKRFSEAQKAHATTDYTTKLCVGLFIADRNNQLGLLTEEDLLENDITPSACLLIFDLATLDALLDLSCDARGIRDITQAFEHLVSTTLIETKKGDN